MSMPRINLTPREAACAQGLAQGFSNKQIARELNVSDSTVKVHIRHMMKKTGTPNRTALMLALADQEIQLSAITDTDVSLAIEDEREECARICDDLISAIQDLMPADLARKTHMIEIAETIAKRIRARGDL
jgi:DNA-binding CsgD family transcriptional regulator